MKVEGLWAQFLGINLQA